MERVKAQLQHLVGGGFVLAPADNEAIAVFSHLNKDELVTIAIYRERNRRFNAKVNLIIERVAKLHGMRSRNLRAWLAAKTGRADVIYVDGAPVSVPWSTSVRDMSAAEFAAFWDDAKPHLYELIKDQHSPEVDDIIESLND